MISACYTNAYQQHEQPRRSGFREVAKARHLAVFDRIEFDRDIADGRWLCGQAKPGYDRIPVARVLEDEYSSCSNDTKLHYACQANSVDKHTKQKTAEFLRKTAERLHYGPTTLGKLLPDENGKPMAKQHVSQVLRGERIGKNVVKRIEASQFGTEYAEYMGAEPRTQTQDGDMPLLKKVRDLEAEVASLKEAVAMWKDLATMLQTQLSNLHGSSNHPTKGARM